MAVGARAGPRVNPPHVSATCPRCHQHGVLDEHACPHGRACLEGRECLACVMASDVNERPPAAASCSSGCGCHTTEQRERAELDTLPPPSNVLPMPPRAGGETEDALRALGQAALRRLVGKIGAEASELVTLSEWFVALVNCAHVSRREDVIGGEHVWCDDCGAVLDGATWRLPRFVRELVARSPL